MKKFVLILALILSLCANAWADVCYNVNETVAKKAVGILKTQKRNISILLDLSKY